MTDRPSRLTALVFVGVSLFLVGCSSAAAGPTPVLTEVIDEPIAAEPEIVEPWVYPAGGEYFFVSADNAVGKFTFPGEPYAPAEEMRALVGGAPVTYVTVVVDNRQGTAPVNMYELAAFDAAGRKYTFTGVDAALERWQEGIGTGPEEVDLYNQFVDAINAHMAYADIGQVSQFVMSSEDTDLPAEFTRIAIQPSGSGNHVEAQPISEAVGFDLSFEAHE